ncbi:uncharacterized protein [Nicotiana sylvestris]|uniref:uncharacterized protein n=1 Tax=Nicotiana sylvestris TaxID=4096 RepID=UPI00388CEAD3
MKTDHDIWAHTPPIDSSWYWRKLNSTKELMKEWYSQGRYTLTSEGSYSITQSYLAILGQQQKMKIADLIWTAVAQPKHRFIGWLATLGRLLTKDRMIGMQLQVEDINCNLCNEDTLESQDHLFVKCSWINAVRQELNLWLGQTVQTTGIKQMLEEVKRKHWKQFKKEVIVAVNIAAVIYHIWRVRNVKIFQGRTVNKAEVVTQIKREVIEMIDLLKQSKKAQKYRNLVRQITCN